MSYRMFPVVAWGLAVVAFVWVATGLAGCWEDTHDRAPAPAPAPVRYISPDNTLAGSPSPGEALAPPDDRAGTIVAVGTIDSPGIPNPSPAPAFQVEIPGETPDETQSPEAVIHAIFGWTWGDYWRVYLTCQEWGVEEYTEKLLYVEWCESRYDDLEVGEAGELGRYQFMPSTWASLPPLIAEGRPWDKWDATQAACYFVSAGREWEWSCWPGGGGMP